MSLRDNLYSIALPLWRCGAICSTQTCMWSPYARADDSPKAPTAFKCQPTSQYVDQPNISGARHASCIRARRHSSHHLSILVLDLSLHSLLRSWLIALGLLLRVATGFDLCWCLLLLAWSLWLLGLWCGLLVVALAFSCALGATLLYKSQLVGTRKESCRRIP